MGHQPDLSPLPRTLGTAGGVQGSARSLVVAATVAGVLLVLSPRVLSRSRPEPCPGGRFLVAASDAPLLQGFQTPATEAVEILPGQLSIDACGPAVVKIKAGRVFTVVRARWPHCGAVEKVRLAGRISAPTCTTLTGTLRAKRRPPKTFTAVRSACGDGRVDPAREECDGSPCPDGRPCTAGCTCAAPTTTSRPPPTTSSTSTTSISTTSQSHTSTTSTSTTTTIPCAGHGSACMASGDCCSGLCTSGSCACFDVGIGCGGNVQCCSSFCNPQGNTCDCFTNVDPCYSGAQSCCSGTCLGGACCQPPGGQCTVDAECCAGAGSCVNSVCGCLGLGTGCAGNVQCCSSFCNPQGNTCDCFTNGDPCYYGAQSCCGGTCVSGTCCQTSGGQCGDDSQCCGGSFSCINHSCCLPPDQPNPLPCSSDSDCCAGVCQGYCTCVPVGCTYP